MRELNKDETEQVSDGEKNLVITKKVRFPTVAL